ncbi:MAG: hypothetical protein JWO93_1857 [Micrococcaceae bacterium]|nr:hypothetical protein [Micrococcaceae bacterium]
MLRIPGSQGPRRGPPRTGGHRGTNRQARRISTLTTTSRTSTPPTRASGDNTHASAPRNGPAPVEESAPDPVHVVTSPRQAPATQPAEEDRSGKTDRGSFSERGQVIAALHSAGKLSEALELALGLLADAEADVAASDGSGGPPPAWITWQAAQLYRGLGNYDGEIALLERWLRQENVASALRHPLASQMLWRLRTAIELRRIGHRPAWPSAQAHD